MKICILDVYYNVEHRISKDQNGQYGTANNYGSGFLSVILKKFVKKNINIPPLYVAQVVGELKKNGHDVYYKNNSNNDEEYDLFIVVSSIVCHELEIDQILKNSPEKNEEFFVVPKVVE